MLTRSAAAARQGRPAAIGRVLTRIVREFAQGTYPMFGPTPLGIESLSLIRLS